MKPLAMDLFCGLGGFTEGLLAEGWDVIGFDIERHEYPKLNSPYIGQSQKCPEGGSQRNSDGKSVFKDRPCHFRDTFRSSSVVDGEWMKYPAQLVLQDVLTLHGSQFKDADLIVASPPCQFFSYTAMPWSRAKALAAEVRADPVRLEKELALFKACFRIQREACEAAGRHIPMVVENVRGGEPWVGRAAGKYGSFYLWGDVPALMPSAKRSKRPGRSFNPGGGWGPHHDTEELLSSVGLKNPGFRFDGSGRSFETTAVERTGVKVPAADGGRRTAHGKGARFTSRDCGVEGTKIGGTWFDGDGKNPMRNGVTKSNARKAASAMIAKIPYPLASWIAWSYYPR